jgi:ferric hydroxamate transport system permease protein
LSQQSWVIPRSINRKVGTVAIVCALVIRPLSLLDLGEQRRKGQ